MAFNCVVFFSWRKELTDEESTEIYNLHRLTAWFVEQTTAAVEEEKEEKEKEEDTIRYLIAMKLMFQRSAWLNKLINKF